MKGLIIVIICIFCFLLEVKAHHHEDQPWHLNLHQHGMFREFFGGFFSTLFLIFGVLVFYYFCLRGGNLGRIFPLFPRKPIIPITVPFARAPNYMEPDGHETIVLTASSPSSVFYSNNSAQLHNPPPPLWKEP